MRLSRLITVVLMVVVMLSTLAFSAYAGRYDNSGKGHDWSDNTKGNSNDNSNTQHNEHGYLNHLPLDADDDGGGST